MPIGILIFAISLMGCKGSDAPKGDVAKKEKNAPQNGGIEGNKAKSGAVQNVPTLKPDFVLTMESLADEFRADKKAAHAKFVDKTVEVTGQMREPITKIQFSMGIPAKSLGVIISCDVLPEDSRKMLLCSPGQKIKISGKCVGLSSSSNVLIQECSLVELEPSTPIVTDAESIAKDFERDPAAATAKYKQHIVVVSGWLDEAVDTAPGSFAKLKGTGKVRVSIQVDQNEFLELREFKGKRVEILGVLLGFEKGEVNMDYGIFVGEIK